jgi:hypothetical protein
MNKGIIVQLILAGAAAVAVFGGLCKAAIFLSKMRKESIDSLRKSLVRTWTNEGDINSEETHFIDLKISLYEGDLIGTIYSRPLESMSEINNRPFDGHINLHWGSATLDITRIFGRNILKIGRVKLRVIGNQNRLVWKLIKKGSDRQALPERTILWPAGIPKPRIRWL